MLLYVFLGYKRSKDILHAYTPIAQEPAKAWMMYNPLLDFFYALFPWYMLRSLDIPRGKKILICTSMSFGVLAGLCGITRAVFFMTWKLGGKLDNLLTVVLYTWEKGIFFVALSIPVLLPPF